MALPTVIVVQCLQGDNVNEGYLLQGTTTSCTCKLDDGGVPRGTVRWSSSVRDHFSIESDTDDIMKILIYGDGAFTCEGRSALKGPYRKHTFSLQTAYGPSRTEISHDPTALVDVCPSTDVYVRVQCSVHTSDVKPEPTFELSSPPQSAFTRVHDYLDSATSEKYTQIYILQPLVGGSHTLTCVARNSKFGQVSATNSTSIYVRAPPSTSPNMVVKGSQPDSLLVEEDDVTVTCTVTGGSPPVESVTITCEGREPVTASGTSVTLTWSNISISDKGTQCVCTASHVTQCYDLTTTVILDVVDKNSDRLLGPGADSSSSDLGIGLGVGLGSAAIIVIILVIVFVIFRRRGWKFKHFTFFGGKRSHQQDQLGLEETQGKQQQQQQQQQQQMQDTHYYEIDINDLDGKSYSSVDARLSDPHKYSDCVVKNQYSNVTLTSSYDNVAEATSHTQDAPTERTVARPVARHTGQQHGKPRQNQNDHENPHHEQLHEQGTVDKDVDECPYEIPDDSTQVKKRATYSNMPPTGLKANYENIPGSSIKETNAHIPVWDTEGKYLNVPGPGIKEIYDNAP